MSSVMDCAVLKLIPANPDISGVGVRVAIYVQNLLSFIPAFYALKDGKISVKELQVVEKQSTTILITAFAVLISAIVQAGTFGLYSFHTSIILSLSWMNNTNTFIYFLLYIQHKIVPEPGVKHVAPLWSAWFRHVVKPLGMNWKERDHYDMEASSAVPEGLLVSPSQGDFKHRLSEKFPQQLSTSAKESEVYWLRNCWSLLRRKFVLVLGSAHLTAMAALGLWMWSSPRQYEVTQAQRLNLTLDMIPLPCTHTALLGSDIPLTSMALKRTSLVFYSVFLAPCLNLVLPVAFFLILFIHFSHSSTLTTTSRTEEAPSATERRLSHTDPFSVTAPISAGAARFVTFLKESVKPIWPILTGLLFLLAINVTFIIDIETTIHRAEPYQDAKDESNWTFGQTLALLLLVLPMRDVYDYIRESREAERAQAGTAELKRAVKRKDLESLRKVARYAGDVNAYVNVDYPSALHFAAFEGDMDIVHVLMERNANVNVEGGEHGPPVVAAASAGHRHIIRAFLEQKSLGAAVGLTDHDDMTALHHASHHGWTDIVVLLLQDRANVSARSSDGRTPLHCAAECGVGDAEPVVRLLISYGADVNHAQGNGQTPLILAARTRDEGVVRHLLLHGANINQADNKGTTPLISAAHEGHEPIAQLLLERGASVNQADKDGNTPLIQAASDGHEPVVHLLLQHGADVKQAKKNGFTPLISAAREGHEPVVRLLLGSDADINQSDGSSKTALYWAADKGHEAIVQLLLERGADVNKAASNGYTPLTWAAFLGRISIMQTLIDSGAELDHAVNDGQTALHCTVWGHKPGATRLLLERGADVTILDNYGTSALELAETKGYEEIATILKEAMKHWKPPSETQQSSPLARGDDDQGSESEVSTILPEQS